MFISNYPGACKGEDKCNATGTQKRREPQASCKERDLMVVGLLIATPSEYK